MGSVVLGAGRECMMNPCDDCGGNTVNPEYPDGLILCDDCREYWELDAEREMCEAEHRRDSLEDR